mgnify:CR=1 FL=1
MSRADAYKARLLREVPFRVASFNLSQEAAAALEQEVGNAESPFQPLASAGDCGAADLLVTTMPAFSGDDAELFDRLSASRPVVLVLVASAHGRLPASLQATLARLGYHAITGLTQPLVVLVDGGVQQEEPLLALQIIDHLEGAEQPDTDDLYRYVASVLNGERPTPLHLFWAVTHGTLQALLHHYDAGAPYELHGAFPLASEAA